MSGKDAANMELVTGEQTQELTELPTQDTVNPVQELENRIIKLIALAQDAALAGNTKGMLEIAAEIAGCNKHIVAAAKSRAKELTDKDFIRGATVLFGDDSGALAAQASSKKENYLPIIALIGVSIIVP